MFEKILLSVDGSEESSRAVQATMELAKLAGSDVLVFHVLEREASRGGVFEMEVPEAAQEAVDDAVRTLKDAGVSVRGEIKRGIYGRVAGDLLDEARAFGAGVIVMGSRGLTDLSGMLLGSVAHKTIHLAECPVLVVR